VEIKYYKDWGGEMREVDGFWPEQAYAAQNPEPPTWATEFDPAVGEFYND